MIDPTPVTLERDSVRLEPLTMTHHDGLVTAAADGKLWELWYTSVPTADETADYIQRALDGTAAGLMLPWAVRDLRSGTIVGSTRYHDMVREIDRVEIGYTWYGVSVQRSHVNTACKLLLLGHAFDTLGCAVVGLRTSSLNLRSQHAIEALGARKDGVLRHFEAGRGGLPRDTVVYSILAAEWPAMQARLTARMAGGTGRRAG